MPSYVFPGTPSRRREKSTKTENKTWYLGVSTISQANSHLRLLISTIELSELNNAEDSDNDPTSETQGSDSRTELDSHANMPVVGQNFYILFDSGIFSEVNAFSPDYTTKNIPIVNAAVRYDFPHSMMTYISVIWNAFHVTSMTNNLIPALMIQESRIMVYDLPKIQVENPTVKDHPIYFQETGLRIPIQLRDVFSYSPTSKPTSEGMTDSEEVYLLMTSRWNPHNKLYSSNKEIILN